MTAPAPRSSRPPRGGATGLVRSLLALSAAQQRTAAAALVVLISLGTPWYSSEVVFAARAGRPASITHGTMSGIGAFSFVEAAVLLVAVAVLVLVWARATERSFSLPAGDGTVITAAAAWIGVLIVYRLFDRPEGSTNATSATLIGLSWGIFASLAAVGLLLATGLDQRRRDAELRASAAPAPEGPVVDPDDVVPVAAPRAGRPAAAPGPDGPPRAAGGRAPRVEPGRPEWAGPAPAPARPREPRSWSWDDPDGPGPEPPRSEPSRRRPLAPGEETRALGRDDAAAELRDAGVGPGASLGRPVPGAAERPGDDRATRVVRPREDEPATRIARPRDEDRATRASPPAGDEATRVVRPADDATRVAGPGPATDGPADDGAADDHATRVHRRRGRRRDER